MHSPCVSAIVPSPSMIASSKNDSGCCPPHLEPSVVDRFLQQMDVPFGEPSAKVAGRGRIGNPPRAQSIEIHLVVPPQFQMFQAGAAGQQIVSIVEHVIRLVIGHVELEQLQARVDAIVQTKRFDDLMDQADPSGCDGPGPLGQFIVDVAGGKHRTMTPAIVAFIQLCQARYVPCTGPIFVVT